MSTDSLTIAFCAENWQSFFSTWDYKYEKTLVQSKTFAADWIMRVLQNIGFDW